MLSKIRIDDYNYTLPDDRIAAYPLSNREASRLLLYDQGTISDVYFCDLPSKLPSDTLMVFNNTRVVPARLLFEKESGAIIEVFCLEPANPSEYNLSFTQTASCSWRAVIGNKKRWKQGRILLCNPSKDASVAILQLEAECVGSENELSIVRFTWQGGWPFSEVLEHCGRIPIPPYLKREASSIDAERYQTVYAKLRGSVAAPTAGLHFSDQVLSSLKERLVSFAHVTLHVGAGTFMPVKSQYIADHIMHSEPFTVSLEFLEHLLSHKGKIVTVGTTSTRCLESLYYFGIQCAQKIRPLMCTQWEAYSTHSDLSKEESLEHLIAYMKTHELSMFSARTQILIVPSFKFQWTQGLITNFHQPKSTLLLLIAAFIGEDWRKCYAHALEQKYRFLSYGDSSLLLPLNF